MIIRNIENTSNIGRAIDKINSAKYEGNAKLFDGITSKSKNGKTITLRLSVHDSHGLGAKISRNRFGGNDRHVKAACWHVHGDFFEALFELEPNAIVTIGSMLVDVENYKYGAQPLKYKARRPIKITKDQGNWQDWNIGSEMYPVQFSESCNCEID